MNGRNTAFATILFCVTFLQMPPVLAEQPDSLQGTILALDKALFDAFNACDLEKWKQYLADDIEFYQDNDDVTTTRRELEPSFMDRCGPANEATLRRELVPGSVEVHPIQGYGAVQLGQHQFWVVNNGKPDELVAEPRFVHLWKNDAQGWRITRVISYAH